MKEVVASVRVFRDVIYGAEVCVFFFKQKTAYEMRISDWSSDVCSSDLIKASDIPVVAFSVGEEELAGIDTKNLVGHLAAWNYFESVKNPVNDAFIKQWHAYIKNPKRVTNDPMEATYIVFKMWTQSVLQAGNTNAEH